VIVQSWERYVSVMREARRRRDERELVGPELVVDSVVPGQRFACERAGRWKEPGGVGNWGPSLTDGWVEPGCAA